MNQYILIVPVLLPIFGGVGMMIFKNPNKMIRPLLIESIVITTSIVSWYLILSGANKGDGVILYRLTSELTMYFKLDGMGMVFSGLISFLWPLATLYAFEYMEHGKSTNTFFSLYTMTFGITQGIALSGNLVTLYLFYEMLTIVTVPLVLYYRNPESRKATQMYVLYSFGGAACAFVAMVFVMKYGVTTNFRLGGVLNPNAGGFPRNTMLAIYVMGFFGFGVKAAVFPLHRWLPAASVAPTPVTALLHAVAVVKAGAFAIMRLTYYSYGAAFLRGTWANAAVVAFAIITVAYASTMGVREVHFKKRLAYSTVSNLSYILLGSTMMCTAGLVAGLTHLVFHAIMKICAFFCAGALMHKANRNYVYELDGLGYKMPWTFTCFTIAGLSLTGIPLFAGFISKWNIVQAALSSGNVLGYLVVITLLYSALMTGIYTMTVVVRAFFPSKDTEAERLEEQKDLVDLHDPTWRMLLPMVIFCILIIVFGIYSKPLIDFYWQIAQGVI